MRQFVLAGAIAALAVTSSVASAQYYADPYGASPLFGYPPPPAYGYVAPPAYGYVEAPEAAVPAPQVYVGPGATFAAQPIIIAGRRYYRDCWWHWGQRKCELKAW